eukprot:CAMPEP_0113952956 /NCGR_PEP_ID=MMETSP1339-20121228/90711_1 /TAXON_ID=94617 /ORGANISM="Fibrocapsa japonica" /LENGTH=163 /DNA_ID=CAMNT_0000961637 /DNA_START=61 /DNA_END=552 /DNA_ORIENTATION=- /assembly_acc=CAM_ASM_000762
MQSPEDRFNQLWVISDIDEIETMPDKNSKTMRKHCVLQNHLKHAGKGQLISSQIETLKTEKNALCDDLPVSEKSQGLLRAVSDSPHVRVQKNSLHYLLKGKDIPSSREELEGKEVFEHTRIIIYQGSVNEVKKSVESASSSFSCTSSFDITTHKVTLNLGIAT